MPIQYEINENIKPELFLQLLIDSGLGDRRPVDDLHCIKGIIENSNLIISARSGNQLQVLTQERLEEHCKLILLASPDAADYYQQTLVETEFLDNVKV